MDGTVITSGFVVFPGPPTRMAPTFALKSVLTLKLTALHFHLAQRGTLCDIPESRTFGAAPGSREGDEVSDLWPSPTSRPVTLRRLEVLPEAKRAAASLRVRLPPTPTHMSPTIGAEGVYNQTYLGAGGYTTRPLGEITHSPKSPMHIDLQRPILYR